MFLKTYAMESKIRWAKFCDKMLFFYKQLETQYLFQIFQTSLLTIVKML